MTVVVVTNEFESWYDALDAEEQEESSTHSTRGGRRSS
jgi:hypothetical protein